MLKEEIFMVNLQSKQISLLRIVIAAYALPILLLYECNKLLWLLDRKVLFLQFRYNKKAIYKIKIKIKDEFMRERIYTLI